MVSHFFFMMFIEFSVVFIEFSMVFIVGFHPFVSIFAPFPSICPWFSSICFHGVLQFVYGVHVSMFFHGLFHSCHGFLYDVH